MALTLVYETAILDEDGSIPRDKAASLAVPTLIMNGSISNPQAQKTAMEFAFVLPYTEHCILFNQHHSVEAEALAPILVSFFTSSIH